MFIYTFDIYISVYVDWQVQRRIRGREGDFLARCEGVRRREAERFCQVSAQTCAFLQDLAANVGCSDDQWAIPPCAVRAPRRVARKAKDPSLPAMVSATVLAAAAVVMAPRSLHLAAKRAESEAVVTGRPNGVAAVVAGSGGVPPAVEGGTKSGGSGGPGRKGDVAGQRGGGARREPSVAAVVEGKDDDGVPRGYDTAQQRPPPSSTTVETFSAAGGSKDEHHAAVVMMEEMEEEEVKAAVSGGALMVEDRPEILARPSNVHAARSRVVSMQALHGPGSPWSSPSPEAGVGVGAVARDAVSGVGQIAATAVRATTMTSAAEMLLARREAGAQPSIFGNSPASGVSSEDLRGVAGAPGFNGVGGEGRGGGRGEGGGRGHGLSESAVVAEVAPKERVLFGDRVERKWDGKSCVAAAEIGQARAGIRQQRSGQTAAPESLRGGRNDSTPDGSSPGGDDAGSRSPLCHFQPTPQQGGARGPRATTSSPSLLQGGGGFSSPIPGTRRRVALIDPMETSPAATKESAGGGSSGGSRGPTPSADFSPPVVATAAGLSDPAVEREISNNRRDGGVTRGNASEAVEEDGDGDGGRCHRRGSSQATRRLLQEALRVKRLLAAADRADASAAADGLGERDPARFLASLHLVELKPLAARLAEALDRAPESLVGASAAAAVPEPRSTRALRDQVCAHACVKCVREFLVFCLRFVSLCASRVGISRVYATLVERNAMNVFGHKQTTTVCGI